MANRLTKIYTKTGDSGTTGLSSGNRISKASRTIAVIGDIDELNAHIGVLRTKTEGEIDNNLSQIQHHLFDLGSDFALQGKTLFEAIHVQYIEQWLDSMNGELPPLKEFILPGGSEAAAHCHVVRTVCRRVERSVTALAENEEINSEALIYINRLSDYFFVLARYLNKITGITDVTWNNRYKKLK